MRLGQSDSATLSKTEVEAVAKAAHLNPRSELPHYLGILEARRLIDRSATEVRVLGITTRATLSHACDILTKSGPSSYEDAAIDLAELTSGSPQSVARSAEYISDTHRIPNKDTRDLIQRSVQIGFVDYEGEKGSDLLFYLMETFSSETPLQNRKKYSHRCHLRNKLKSRNSTIF